MILLNKLPNGESSIDEEYYLLSNDLPEDYELRIKLQKNRLDAILTLHQYERSDQTFERSCLYCRDIIKSTRSAYIQHLFTKHYLQLGKSENLIFIDELIDNLQMKLEQLICLYCEKIFKDRATLKEHMRKKGHKRINPDNKAYDCYFLINYQKNVHTLPSMYNNKLLSSSPDGKLKESSSPSNIFQSSDCSDSDWSDWDGDKQILICLFCSNSSENIKEFKLHLNVEHYMSFDSIMSGLTFYQKIKVINYIRRQIHDNCCIYCCTKFINNNDLLLHMKNDKHYVIGKKELWNQPKYFFSTYEDDAVLFHLDDTSNINDTTDDSSIVVSEETKIQINEVAEALSKENLLSY